MTTFDDREQAYEKKFALDQDLKFRAESRRNKLLAEWAAGKLGISGEGVQDYVRSLIKADMEEKKAITTFSVKFARTSILPASRFPTPRSAPSWASS